jgi:16S rRNA (cytosine967-C5)-methyltransferase
MSDVRWRAYSALMRVARGEAYANLALQQALRGSGLEARDRALLTEIVYGTVQRQRTLDWLLRPFLRCQPEELDVEVLTILRMAVYQLGYLDRVPAYAAVAEAVNLCKRVRPRAAGLVNGVLRAYLRDGRTPAERLAAEAPTAEAERIGVELSYPNWLVEAFVRQFGRERAERILAAGNQPAPLSVRVNGLRADVEQVLAALSERLGPIATKSPLAPEGVRLQRGVAVEEWDLYRDGRISVQDEAAMLVSPLLRPRPGQKVLDLCAAPGTKTTHIAELMRDEGHIDACDIHAHKRRLIEEAALRLGLRSIHTLTLDARLLPNFVEYRGTYDAVLVDAPCSGLGVLRHRPDIRWRRTPADVEALSQLQRQLLRAAATLVRPGGRIVYSTCTVLAEENDQVVQCVVSDPSLDLELDDIRGDLPEAVTPYVSAGGGSLLLTPELFGTDGFYMARLRKRG